MLPWPVEATYALLRVLLALALLAIALPSALFAGLAAPDSSPWLSRAIWMVFGCTVLVHLLTALHIYEGIVFLVILLLAVVGRRLGNRTTQGLQALRVQTVGSVLDFMDDTRDAVEPLRRLDARGWVRGRRVKWQGLILGLLLLIVGAVAVRLLFTEAFTTPAPPFSDAPTNIKWLKELPNEILYSHDEVYPRGAYAWLSVLQKFTVLNPVVLFDICGPLVGLGILLSVLFYVYKTTRSPGATLVAAVLYGTLPLLFFSPGEFARHGAPNSQEYSMMFVLPATWFAYAYLVRGRPVDRATAAAGAGVIAFTHPVSTLFVIVALGGTAAAVLLQQGRAAWHRLRSLILWVGAAGILAALPLGVALVLGLKWHGSSFSYLQQVLPTLPPLNRVHLIICLAMGVLAPVLLWLVRRRSSLANLGPMGALATLAALSLLISLLPALGVRSQPLWDRRVDMAAMGVVLAAALAWALLERLLLHLWPRVRALVPLLIMAAAVVAWYRLPQTPAQPYHYYTAEMIESDLWAESTYLPGEWTLVSSFLGYSLAIGRSFHLYPLWFLEMAKQMPDDVSRWYEADYTFLDTTVNQVKQSHDHTAHYLLLVEHTTPTDGGGLVAPWAKPVESDAAALRQWIEQKKDKLPLRLLFTDDKLEVWLLDLPLPKPSDSPDGSNRR